MDKPQSQVLAPSQKLAIRHVAAAVPTGTPLDPNLRVTLNFHPDRVSDGRSILHALAEDGAYRSQFLTGTSNGGLTAYVGGDRWHWESRIFGGAYDNAPAHERPVYGALNFRRQTIGAAPRFGSAHLRLTAETLPRATFCYPDSFVDPSDFGVAARMPLIELAEADSRDALDDYIEAQVHGPVLLTRHIEALVLDPCYQGTAVEAEARRLPCPIEWHPGYRLSVEELRRHPDFRGQEYVDLGTEIAIDGHLDPRIIGDAVRTGRYDQQDLKKVWHYLARFGAPAGSHRPARLSLRPAEPADVEVIAELRATVMRPDLERLGRFDEHRVRQRLRDSFSPQHTSVIVADGAFAGCITLRPAPDGQWLEHFYLTPDFQGKGLGSAVLRELLARTDAEGATVRLNVLQGSTARRLYERHGFTVEAGDAIDIFMVRPPSSGL